MSAELTALKATTDWFFGEGPETGGLPPPIKEPKINLAWDHVLHPHGRTQPPAVPGLNVIPPTWFRLDDQHASVRNFADSRYVEAAHRLAYQVWSLVDNGFDPKRTHAVLADTALRQRLIDQLLTLGELYELDGLNIDFENVCLQDGPLLTQFLRELAGSRRSGSVASLPWVASGPERVLRQVPSERLILGVPFYTRLWAETRHQGDEAKVTSSALSMDAAERLLADRQTTLHWDDHARQHYGEFSQGDTRHRIWLEDERSMAATRHLGSDRGGSPREARSLRSRTHMTSPPSAHGATIPPSANRDR